MSTALFLFYDRLNFFLPRDRRERPILVKFKGRQSIKHLAESLGVPHPEIGRIKVRGQAGSLGQITQDGDCVEIHPIEDGFPGEPRFLLDGHLGKLTSHLRMLGFDCLYQNRIDDPELAEISLHDERILLTRDRRLLMRKIVQHGFCLRSLDSFEQLLEVINRFDLAGRVRAFHRCIRCNHPLEPVSKQAVLHRLEPLTRQYFEEFHICPACAQIYWKGSHFERMQAVIQRITGAR